MKTTIKMLAAAAMALTSTIGMARDAAPQAQRSFVHEGSTYVYTTTAAPHGRTVLTGRRLPAGDTFRLVVDGNQVTGVSGGNPVSFRTATARGAAGGVQVAAN